MSKLSVALFLGCICLLGVALYLYDVGERHQRENRRLRDAASAAPQVRQSPQAPQAAQDHASAPGAATVRTTETPTAPEKPLPDIESMKSSEIDPHLKRLMGEQLSVRSKYEGLKRVLTEIQANIRRKEVDMARLPPGSQVAEQDALDVLQKQEERTQASLLESEARLGELGVAIAQLGGRQSAERAKTEDTRGDEQKQARKSSREENEQAARERTLRGQLRQDQRTLQDMRSRAARLKGDVEGCQREMRLEQARISEIVRSRVGPNATYTTAEDKQAALDREHEKRAQILARKNRAQADLDGFQERIKHLEKSIADAEAELAPGE